MPLDEAPYPSGVPRPGQYGHTHIGARRLPLRMYGRRITTSNAAAAAPAAGAAGVGGGGGPGVPMAGVEGGVRRGAALGWAPRYCVKTMALALASPSLQ